LALFQGFDYAVEARYVWHVLDSLGTVQVVQMFEPFKPSNRPI
jgi:hypothetical protein